MNSPAPYEICNLYEELHEYQNLTDCNFLVAEIVWQLLEDLYVILTAYKSVC